MSEIRATTISDSAGTGPITLTGQSAAKAWVSINQSSTLVVNSSFNISSSVDVQTGYSYHNLTNSYSNTHFTRSASASSNILQSGQYEAVAWPKGVGSFWLYAHWQGTVYDLLSVVATTHGDLA